MKRSLKLAVLCMFTMSMTAMCAPGPGRPASDLFGKVEFSKHTAGHHPAVVVWLNSVEASAAPLNAEPAQFTLAQKDRMFSPHILVVPVGSVVSFPNQDPFFHNVFSLFNGKRFDLGLYEAGASKQVRFAREGISYIFCNIHPGMSALVIALATPYHATADYDGSFVIREVPEGEYEMHVWIEGSSQASLDKMTRRLRIRADTPARVEVDATGAPPAMQQHLDKFGHPYDTRDNSPY